MRVTSPSQYSFSAGISLSIKKPKKNSKVSSQQNENPVQKSNRMQAVTTIPSNIVSSQKMKKHIDLFTPEAEKMYNRAVEIAKQFKSPTVEVKHVWLAGLEQTNDYLESLNEGRSRFETESEEKRQGFMKTIIANITDNPSSMDVNEPKIRRKFQKVIQEHISAIEDDLSKEASEPIFNLPPSPSKKFLKAMDVIAELMYSQTEVATFADSYFYLMGSGCEDKKTRDYSNKLIFDVQKAMMIENGIGRKKYYLNFYDEKADEIWRSLDLGNDTMILCEDENNSSLEYLKSSFVNLIKKPGQKYRNLSPDNVEIINLNEFANLNFLSKLIPEINKKNQKEGKVTVIIGDIIKIIKASNLGSSDENTFVLAPGELDIFSNANSDGKKNPYVRFLFTISPNNYHANINHTDSMSLGGKIKDYASQILPSITAQQAKEYLANETGIAYVENEIGKSTDAEAIKKAVDLTNDEKGNYPDKVLDLLNRVSKFFVDEDSVTQEQVIEYMREMQILTETTNDDDINIVYDTGKTLADIVGSKITREAAQSVVDEIKYGAKTKGYLIYQASFTSDGGGRRNTAEAIAGEAKIPIITINTKEFLTKDLTTLYQNPDVAELKIKTLVSKVKAQAKTNSNKTAMIYIENFDNFATDEYKGYPTGSFEQKAFSQLLEEMKKAKKEGVNLIVIGSVNNREVIDESIRKPGKFMDEIVIYPPADENERKDVINYYIGKMNLSLKGDKEEQETIINHAAITSDHFSVVDIMYMLETANNVSHEKGKTEIDKSDITEAYLRTTTGRTNKYKISDHRKQIVTSHEAGHALTLQIMYNIAESQNKPWKLPNKVNFITLDPRGWYGGAMYPKDSENEEYSFEKIFADIVCDYGGHSSEKTLYGFTGSWGITADMEMARYQAESAVVDMGMGAKTGVRHIKRNVFGALDVSDKQKQTIEDDEELLLSAAEKVSDKIVEEYEDFIKEFTQRHWRQVGSGECIIPSEEFNQELTDWINAQTQQKREHLEFLNEQIKTYTSDIKHGKFNAELNI